MYRVLDADELQSEVPGAAGAGEYPQVIQTCLNEMERRGYTLVQVVPYGMGPDLFYLHRDGPEVVTSRKW